MAYFPNTEQVISKLISANLNSTADQLMSYVNFSKYNITRIIVTNASINLGALVTAGGVYTAASKGGTNIVGSGQVYTALTSATTILSLTFVAGISDLALTSSSLYFSLTVAAGTPATADIYVYAKPLV